MKSNHLFRIHSRLVLSFTMASTLGLCLSTMAVGADQGMEDGKGMGTNSHMKEMHHILTQAQAEALKPGDSMSMACSSCKMVTVQTVTNDQSHVKMMTVGQKSTCGGCKSTVEVVATGKGQGKDAEVKHVCSTCGDDVMFCTATKAGSNLPADASKSPPAKP